MRGVRKAVYERDWFMTHEMVLIYEYTLNCEQDGTTNYREI